MDPRLFEAVRQGNITELQKLLEKDSLVLGEGPPEASLETILHIAAMVGKTDLVRALLQRKPEFAQILDKHGFGAIHIASANGFVEMVKELLRSSGQLARLKSSDGRTTLHCAVVTGRIPIIVELLGRFQNCIGDVTYKGETAFHLAVKYNQFEGFKTMVDLSKELNMKEILIAGDEDGNTVLHLAVARRQTQIVKMILGGDVCPQELVVNLINKRGLTALNVSDVLLQAVGEPADFVLRDLLLRAGALRASEVGNVKTSQVYHEQISVTPLRPQALWHMLLNRISLLNLLRHWRMLAKEVKTSPSQTQNALLVVAVLIATMTYQAILSPPDGLYVSSYDSGAYISYNLPRFLLFMVPNFTGFFASLLAILLVMENFPLNALLGIAVRCMASSYLCGFFVIGPTSIHASRAAAATIGLIISIDFVRFCCWLVKRWSEEIRRRRIFCVVSLPNSVASTGRGLSPSECH